MQNLHKRTDGTLIMHKDVHNAYGLMLHKTTREAILARNKNVTRPFVLTRSYFLGGQKFGAHWTGDNWQNFEEMQGAINMLVSSGLAGFFFGGADIPGFSSDWYTKSYEDKVVAAAFTKSFF